MCLHPASADGIDSTFPVKKSVLIYNKFDILLVFSFNVINVVFHLINYNITIMKDAYYTWRRCLYILCNIILLRQFFVEDGKHFNFYLLGGSWCQNLSLLCRVMGKRVSNWRRDLWPLRSPRTSVKFEVCSPFHSEDMADFRSRC